MHLPLLTPLTAAARSWPVRSQQTARRNAMLAATECAQRRAERQEVRDYLALRAPAIAEAGPAVRVGRR